MKVLFYELKKLTGYKSFLFIILASLVLGVYSNIRSVREAPYKPSEYRMLSKETDGMSNDEIGAYISENIEKSLNDEGVYSVGFILSASDRYNEIQGYSNYLDNIDERCRSIVGFSLFGSKNSFSYKNALKTRDAYRKVRTRELPFAVSEGSKLVLVNETTDILLIFVMFAAAVFIFTKDKEIGINGLLYSCPKGRTSLCRKKLAVLFCFSVLINLLFFFVNLVNGMITYGIGDLSRPLQSVEGFMECSFNINLLQYSAVMLLYKTLGCFIWGCVFSFICIISTASISIYGLSALIGVTEIYLSRKFAYNSDKGLLHDINLVTFIKPESVFSSYRNLNISGNPVYIGIGVPAAAAVLIIVLVTLCLMLYSRLGCREYRHIGTILGGRASHTVHSRMFYTLKKSLVLQKNMYVILVWVVIVVIFHTSFTKPAEIVDLHYKNYTTDYKGEVTAEVDEIIRNDGIYFDDVRQKLLSPKLSDDERRFLQNEQFRMEAYAMFTKRCEAIRNKNGAELFYDTGYKRAFGIGKTKDHLIITFLVMILCVLVISPLISFDNSMNMTSVIFSTASGKKSYLKHGIIVTVTLSVFASIAVMFPYFFNILSKYGTQGITLPVQSLEHFADFTLPLNVWQYALGLFLVRTMVFTLCSLAMCLVSKHSKSRFSATLINVTVFVMPVLIMMVGSRDIY